MQAFTFPRKNSDGIFAAQQRFSFGKSPEEVLAPRRYRAGWISDAHLGTRGCNATALLDFLRGNDFETLYIVGDLIDVWSLRRGIYWPQQHNDVIQKILRKSRKGTHVIYIPGNHDELVGGFCGAYGNIEIKQRAIHVAASGERVLIIHGHELDAVVQNVKWLAFAGDLGYQFLLSLNPLINFVRRRFGLGYWSLSAYAKRRVKDAVSFIREFGHITYYNCGDWVESCTALVEGDDGILSMLNYHPLSSNQISRNRMTESLSDEQSLLAGSA
jgi:UDP-2,3-diacylglucosamine pyrophosphatase LpxH